MYPRNANNLFAASYDRNGFLGVMDAEHSHVHRGNAYIASCAGQITDTTPAHICFKTGSKSVHLKDFMIEADGTNITFAKFFGSTVTNDGTRVEAYNCNLALIHSKPKTVDIYYPASPPSDMGLDLNDKIFLFGSEGVGGRTISSGEASSWERIIPPNSTLICRASTTTTGTTNIEARFFFYETDPLENRISRALESN